MDKLTPAPPVNITFVMEQHLGHETYYRNLRRAVENLTSEEPALLSATWVEVDYDRANLPAGPLSALPGSVRGPLTGLEQVVRGIRSSKPDVLFFNTQVPAVMAMGQLGSTPYVVATDITPRQYDRMADEYQHRPDRNKLVAGIKHRANVRTFGRAGRVVCWSSWCAGSVRSEYGVEDERIEVIAPGVDVDQWKPERAGVAGPAVRLLFVGGDFHRKGGAALVAAFGRLPSGVAELHLVTRTAVSFDRDDIFVHNDLAPNSPELMAMYRGSDIFVLPSRAEAFGIAATEALACGLPVIATRGGGLSDIVEGDTVSGETVGRLVDRVDADGLYKAILQLSTDEHLRRRMAAAARRRAERLFDADRNGRRIAELLMALGREAVNAGSRRA